MKPMLLAAGIAAAALATAGAQAASGRHAGAYAEPKQPIAYSSLNAYLKASPKQRAARDWSGGAMAVSTGTPVNAAAVGANTSTALGPMTKETPNTVSVGSPTVAPDANLANTQAPLNQAPNDNGQPPASNQPVTEQPSR